jgi:hypothetical protein
VEIEAKTENLQIEVDSTKRPSLQPPARTFSGSVLMNETPPAFVSQSVSSSICSTDVAVDKTAVTDMAVADVVVDDAPIADAATDETAVTDMAVVETVAADAAISEIIADAPMADTVIAEAVIDLADVGGVKTVNEIGSRDENSRVLPFVSVTAPQVTVTTTADAAFDVDEVSVVYFLRHQRWCKISRRLSAIIVSCPF